MKKINDRSCFEWMYQSYGGETTQNIRKSRDKYKNLFTYQNIEELDKEVNKELENGWKLRGNIRVTLSPHGVMFIQTMVKKEIQ